MLNINKATDDIWSKPLELGFKRRCVACNKLVLRKGGKRGPQPKFCTHKCYVRTHRKKMYLKNQELEKQYAREYRAAHPELIKQYNASWQAKYRERKNWKYNYLETLKI